jgi:sigma-B regulation protein RsbU (phosphoserine phosphatase)
MLDMTKIPFLDLIRGVRLKLRWKFFLILFIFSLIPLLAVLVIHRHGARLAGLAISGDQNKQLTKIVGRELTQSAENSAKVLLRTKDAMEYYLQMLGRDTVNFLAERPPEPTQVYFAEDFDDIKSAPPDFLPSRRYFIRSDSGQLIPNPVSFNHPVVFLALQVDRDTVSGDIARLTRLVPTFKRLSSEFGNKLYWTYISLQSGVHISYPGHRGFPENYDPRKRPWYKNAGRTATWSRPLKDATTGQTIFTVSKRLYHPDGTFLGVAALDILVSEILKESDLFPLWSAEMRSLMVASYLNPETRRIDLEILAQKDLQINTAAWDASIPKQWMSSSTSAGLDVIIERLKAGKSGYVRMAYKGEDSIWAYADIDGYTHFIVTMPHTVVKRISQSTSQTFNKFASNQLIITGTTAFIVLVLLALAAVIGSRAITRSLLQITTAAEQLSRGDFSVRLDLRTGDERDRVIQAFNEIGPKLEDNIRLQQSLDLAMKVQQKLLPDDDPKIPGLDIAGKSIYCDETGGDYYDYLAIQENMPGKVNIVVGDVSGHGISSALLMASARAYLRQRVSMPGRLDEIIADVNRQLIVDVAGTNRFVTLFMLEIDMLHKQLKWVRAGHVPAILYDRRTDSFEELRGAGIPLGVEVSWIYEENIKSDLSDDQIIFLATDGVWEQRNPDGEMFWKDRVNELIRKNSTKSAGDIIHIFIDALNRFKGDLKFEDDVTMVVVKLK